MKKKGSIGDMLFLMIFGFICAIIFISGWMFMSKVNTEVQAGDLFSTEGKTIMQNSTNRYVNLFDGLFLTVMIALFIGALILAFQINTHPVFFFATIIVYVIIVVLAGILGNAFYQFAAGTEVVSYSSGFTIIPFVLNHYVQVMLVMAFILAIVMYGKFTSE